MTEPVFGVAKRAYLRESKTNPRKSFDPVKLAELADSIKKHGIIQPILVRPIPDTDDEKDILEIIFGARRYRASGIAEVDEVPIMVRTLTDEEVIILQVIENLQREDVHPIEEAEGYDRLMREFGHTADQLAQDLGKSKAYVYARLKLCALSETARQTIYNDGVSASTALLIARISVASLQEQAVREITQGMNGEPMSYRQAVQHVQNHYMLDLSHAPFSIHDTKLLPTAGPCTTCTKRSGNQTELFSDVASADVCTDTACFGDKRAAHNDKLLAAAKKKKILILEGTKNDNVHSVISDLPGDFVTLDRRADYLQRLNPESKIKHSSTIEDVLEPENWPTPHAYVKLENGQVQPVFDRTAMQDAMEKAGLCLTLEEHTRQQNEKLGKSGGKDSKKNALDKEAEKNAIIQRKAELESEYRGQLYRDIRAKLIETGSLMPILKTAAKVLACDNNVDSSITDLYSIKINEPKTSASYLDQADGIEVMVFLLDIALGCSVHVGHWEIERKSYEQDAGYLAMLDLAKEVGIDAQALHDKLAAPPEPTSPAKDKPKKAKAKPKSDTTKEADPAPEQQATPFGFAVDKAPSVDEHTANPNVADRDASADTEVQS